MNDPILGRKKIRVILSALPAKFNRVTEEFLMHKLGELFPEPVQVDELLQWIEWNHARNYIESRWDEDNNRTVWYLTDQGKQKEGL